jgi:ABC-type lipoprotein export system ATPase subunit
MFNLIPYLSVLDNVLLPCALLARRRGRWAHATARRRRGRRLLAALGPR